MRHSAEFACCGVLRVLVPLLPRRAVVVLSNIGGATVWLLAGELRRVALANLDLAFGQSKSPAEKRRIGRASFANFIRVGLDFFWSRRLNAGNWQRYMDFTAPDMLISSELIRRGKGVIGVTLHFGNWEWLGLGGGYQGMPLTIITEELQNPHLDRLVNRLRQASGNQLIYQRGAAPKVMRALRKGQVVCIVMDTNAPAQWGGIWPNFFGLPAATSPVAAALALRTGAPIVVSQCYPLPDGRYRLSYGPEIIVTPGEDTETNRLALTQKIMDVAEQIIREHPEHWLWMYKRWKRSPTDSTDGFPFYSKPARDYNGDDE